MHPGFEQPVPARSAMDRRKVALVGIAAVKTLVRPLVHAPRSSRRMPRSERDEPQVHLTVSLGHQNSNAQGRRGSVREHRSIGHET